MIKGIDTMDNQNNQNANGVFENNENKQTSSQLNQNTIHNDLNTTILQQQGIGESTNQVGTMNTINSPTLDSILNGNDVNQKPSENFYQNSSVENKTETLVDSSWENYSPNIASIPSNMLKEEPMEIESTTPIETFEQNRIEPINNIHNETEEPNGTINTQPTEILESTTIPDPVENKEIEVAPINSEINATSTPVDEFSQVPIPPVFEDTSKKKKGKDNKSILIIFLIIVLIGAIGIGVYYFLTLAKESATKHIVPKEIKLELGSVLSNDVEDYATISGYSKNDCLLNLNEVNVNKVSTYKYKIICGKENAEGTIIVDDSTKPEAITNDLVLLPNATIKEEDFIEKCLDASKCTYKFKTDISTIVSTLGEHEVEIIISDEYNNQNTVKAKLTIANQAPVKYLKCSKPEEQDEELKAKITDSYIIGIDAKDNFYMATRKTQLYFDTLNNYNDVAKNYNKEVGIKNRVGMTTFNEANKMIIIKENKTLEDMNKDLNGRLPNNSNILRAYLSGLGYICN